MASRLLEADGPSTAFRFRFRQSLLATATARRHRKSSFGPRNADCAWCPAMLQASVVGIHEINRSLFPPLRDLFDPLLC